MQHGKLCNLQVLDPRKCEYLKDYSLDFEHAYMTNTLLHEIEEILEMFATTVQAELSATLHVCESGLQDIRIFSGLLPKESPV
jgi:hypothetical protein